MPQYDFDYPFALSAAKGLTVRIKSLAKRLRIPFPQYDFLHPFALSAAKGLKVCIKPPIILSLRRTLRSGQTGSCCVFKASRFYMRATLRCAQGERVSAVRA